MNFGTEYVIRCVIELLGAIFCGVVLGIERQTHNQMVGMRTLVLICVSCCLLSQLSAFMADNNFINITGDPTRIASGVVSGIGFLGGGAIIKQGLNIKGLTTATIIWVSASLGLSIGAGLYIQSAMVLVSVIAILFILEKLKHRVFANNLHKTLHLCFEQKNIDIAEISKILKKYKIIISDLNLSRVICQDRIILHYSVRCHKEDNYSALVEDLRNLGNLTEFSITE